MSLLIRMGGGIEMLSQSRSRNNFAACFPWNEAAFWLALLQRKELGPQREKAFSEAWQPGKFKAKCNL